jgi:hypothetical protein
MVLSSQAPSLASSQELSFTAPLLDGPLPFGLLRLLPDVLDEVELVPPEPPPPRFELLQPPITKAEDSSPQQTQN